MAEPYAPQSPSNTRNASRVELNQWKGMFSNASLHATQESHTVVQENIGCLVAGRIEVRGGMRAVTFEN